jgi:hypothetical protein
MGLRPRYGAKRFAIVGGVGVTNDFSIVVAVTPRLEEVHGVLNVARFKRLNNVLLCLVSN